MLKPSILIVDDQRDVLTAVRKDLQPLQDYFSLELCESADEAKEVLEELDAKGETAALIICDHIMAEKNGVEFLIELHKDARFEPVKKLLLTGLATHKDTIAAINQASIDRYLEKPWEAPDLLSAVKVLVTQFLLHSGKDYQPFLPVLDQPTVYRAVKERT